ncbi:anti-sigma factor [Oceanicola sp. S124]|uniref:anti-sigma factor n=1 Tax=Oceanicola sp. S124 TaxID=1042378 RepID=UPI0002558241|nr:anti-sigma factor [Oceanicola sp. S124]
MTERSLDDLLDEIALGLASAEDQSRIEAMAAQDAALAARLDRARQRFAPLDDTAPVLPLPQGFWQGIAARLDGATDLATTGSGETAPASGMVVDLARVKSRLGRWRGTALGAIAASLLLACVTGWTLLSPPAPLVIAVLMDAEGEAFALIESGADNTTRVTLLEPADVPAGQVMQVWTKPDEAGPPVSLGLLVEGSSRTLSISGLPAPGARQLYEITAEPAGGSPTNLPTGPILGVGLAKEPVL